MAATAANPKDGRPQVQQPDRRHVQVRGLKGALSPYRGKHFAAITDPVKLGELLRAIQAYRGGPIVRAALQLAPMLFPRPGELRAAE